MSPTVDETMDMQAYFVRDVPQVKILNDFAENMQARPNDSVHVHDLRRETINQQFAEEIEICRRKVNNPKSPVVGFAEEAVCFTPKGYFELKTARSDETFLNVSAGSDRMAEALDPNRRNVHVKWDALRNPQVIEGRNLVFLGVGKPSNYYHWIGEQMPRLALLRKHVDLATLDHVVVFVRTPVPFIETSLRTLFPEFTGKVEADEDAATFGRDALNGLALVTLLLTALAMIFMPALVWVTAEGFYGDERFDLTVGFDVPVSITVPADDTNASLTDLIEDINEALGDAGLGATVYAEQSQQGIVIATLEPGFGAFLEISNANAVTTDELFLQNESNEGGAQIVFRKQHAFYQVLCSGPCGRPTVASSKNNPPCPDRPSCMPYRYSMGFLNT